ncbi:MAG: hypothetical protein ACREP6_15625, partial [Candidatus Binataceae bacterium]
GLGFAFASYSIWQMAGWNLQVSMSAILWPILIFGFGSMGWPLLSAAALGDVPKERMGYAASLYNMMRNTGAAVGISFVSNFLTEREQVHQSYLVQHFSVFDAWKMTARMPRIAGAPHFNVIPGLSGGANHGLGLIYSQIQAQATLLAYNDIYRMLAFCMVLLIPLFVLFKKPTHTSGGAH